MTTPRPQDQLVQQLIETFHDYHTRIASQMELVHEIVRSVREDERERCARLADDAGQPALASRIRAN
jgi:hypothetical protein